MLIEIKKQTTEAIEIKTPYYCKGNTFYHQITEKGDLINVNGRQISVWEAENIFNKSSVREALENSVECSREEFNQAFRDAAKKIGEHAVKLIQVNEVTVFENQQY